MKTAAIFAVAVLSAGILLANGAQAAQSTDTSKTRAQVIAELAQARANGEIPAYSSDATGAYLFAQRQAAQTAAASKTRAQVVAELNQARADGSLAARNADDAQVLQAGQAARTRLAAKSSGDLNAE